MVIISNQFFKQDYAYILCALTRVKKDYLVSCIPQEEAFLLVALHLAQDLQGCVMTV